MDGETLTASHWFRQLLASHKRVLSAAAAAGRFVLVPQTASLLSFAVTARDVQHHVLEAAPGAPRGEFRTLSGRTAVVTSTSVITGAGFAERVEATILAAATLAVELPPADADGAGGGGGGGGGGGARRQGRLQLYFLSRPLEGGLAAPSRVDELTADGIRKYLALLQSAPDVDACFAELEAGTVDIARGLTERRGAGAGGRGSAGDSVGASPLAAAAASAAAASVCASAERALRELCESVCDQALDSAMFEDDSDEAFARSRQQVSQCLESWCAERLHDSALSALREELAGDVAQLRSSLERAASKTMADLGVKPAFRCDFGDVARLLAELPRRRTPLEKLHCVRDASVRARALVERHLEEARVDLAEVDFGTDDELPILAWAILLAQRTSLEGANAGAGAGAATAAAAADFAGAGAELPLHLAFAQRFRLESSGDLEKSQLGFRLANLEQALNLFREQPEEGEPGPR